MIFWLLRVLALLVGAGALLGIVLGLLQNFHPAMDSFSHFRLHLIVVLVISCVILVFVSRRSTRTVALLLAALGIGWLFVDFSKGPAETGERGAVRLAQFNLNFRNRVMDQVGQALIDNDVDLVMLQEVTAKHEAALRGLSAFPHQTHCSFRDFVGAVSILSKYPLSGINCVKGQGLVTALVELPDGAVTVGSIHTFWPWPYRQHAQVDKWVSELRKTWGPMIIAGDFNAAPWSHAVAKLSLIHI